MDYTEDIDCDDVYHLIDGDISIAEAAAKANEILAKTAEQCGDGEFLHKVCAVKVVDIGEGCYGYYFTITPVVDGIKYAFADMRSDTLLGTGSFYNEEGGDSAGCYNCAEMIRSDELCAFTVGGKQLDRTAVAVHDSIVPLKTAAENAAKLLSGEMTFKAKSVTLVYDIEGSSDELLPCWRFVLENSSPQKYYHVYVNAITGKARVKCIQQVDSGYEFD